MWRRVFLPEKKKKIRVQYDFSWLAREGLDFMTLSYYMFEAFTMIVKEMKNWISWNLVWYTEKNLTLKFNFFSNIWINNVFCIWINKTSKIKLKLIRNRFNSIFELNYLEFLLIKLQNTFLIQIFNKGWILLSNFFSEEIFKGSIKGIKKIDKILINLFLSMKKLYLIMKLITIN